MERTLPATWRLPHLTWRYMPRRDVTRLVAVGLLGLAWYSILMSAYASDAYVYWWAAHLPTDLYPGGWNQDLLSFVYSPAFAQVLSPIAALPMWLWYMLYTGALIALLAWLVSPELAVLLLVPIEPFRHEVTSGNINLLLAGAIVVGMRYPAAWAFVLLTKITPGVGLLWFAVRREWRSLAVAVGASAAIALTSFAAAPMFWWQWLDRMQTSTAAVPVPLLPRFVLALLVVSVGARRGYRWCVPLAAWLALPNIGQIVSLTMLAALPRLALPDLVERKRR